MILLMNDLLYMYGTTAEGNALQRKLLNVVFNTILPHIVNYVNTFFNIFYIIALNCVIVNDKKGLCQQKTEKFALCLIKS